MAIETIETAMVKITAISVTENVRKNFDKKKMAELTENVKKYGVLVPLLVRPAPGVAGAFVLIAGERRLRAAEASGLMDVPVRVLDVDDAAAAEIQALENLHRADLTPIEEAQAFKMLMEKAGYSVEDLANKIDKSQAYVYRAVRLLDLPKSVVLAIDEGKLTQAHGHELLRIQSKRQQEELAKQCVKETRLARDLHDMINDDLGRDLTRAPFPKDNPYAGQMACAKCPYNSGNQGDLFDGVEKGRCTNVGCFDAKVNAYVDWIVHEHKEKNPKMNFIGIFQNEYSIKTPHGTDRIPVSADVKALMAENPGSFSWAVAHEHEGWKVFYFAPMTSALRKATGRESQRYSEAGNKLTGPQDERPSRIEAVQKLIDAAVRKECWEKSAKALTAKDLLNGGYGVISNSEVDAICQTLQIRIKEVEAWPVEKLLKLLWFIRAAGLDYNGFNDLEEKLKVNRKAIEKQIKKEADETWPKTKSPACSICGCTPNRACAMGRKDEFRSCWWVRPGICSACQDKPNPAAAAKK